MNSNGVIVMNQSHGNIWMIRSIRTISAILQLKYISAPMGNLMQVLGNFPYHALVKQMN